MGGGTCDTGDGVREREEGELGLFIDGGEALLNSLMQPGKFRGVSVAAGRRDGSSGAAQSKARERCSPKDGVTLEAQGKMGIGVGDLVS